jgi:periplasmic protein TonB
MVIALALLVLALGIVLYKDRNFWFPDMQEAQEQPNQEPTNQGQPQTAPAVANSGRPTTIAKAGPAVGKKAIIAAPSNPAAPAATDAASSEVEPPGAIVNRTVLPPLEVEVVAGDTHRTVRPGNNSVHVNLQPGVTSQTIVDAPATAAADTPAAVTNPAAERVQMSTDTTDAVTHPVKPAYPLLARQMKVQGSVILQALIGRDGDIQGLHVVSGPPILAGAAQEAVKQWRFKPHYQGQEAVETQAKITVNFTISTN